MQPPAITERQVRDALKGAGTVTLAAVALGISRRTIYRLMRRYGIEIKRIVG